MSAKEEKGKVSPQGRGVLATEGGNMQEATDRREVSKISEDKRKEEQGMTPSKCAKLYQKGTLDCLVRLVEGISRDFRETDDIYQNLDAEARVPLRKVVLRSVEWEDAGERAQLYNRVLSRSDLTAGDPAPAGFPTLSKNLREAAREWGTRKDLAVQEAYMAEVKNRARSLREYLQQKSPGASVADADDTLGPIFDATVKLLTNVTLIGAFSGAGNGPSRKDKWPYEGDDGGALRLVNAIANRLATRNLLDAETARLIQSGNVSSVLQMAHLGGQVIDLVLDDGWEKNLGEIANYAFQWDRYYGDLNRQGGGGEIARAARPRAVA